MKSSFEPTSSERFEPTFQPDAPGCFELDEAPSQSKVRGNAEDRAKELAAAFESGLEEGLATATSRCEPALRALSAAAAEFAAQKHEYVLAQRRLVVELAVEIAEHILGRAVAANPDMIIGRIEDAMALADGTAAASIGLNPDDHALVTGTAHAATFLQNVDLTANAELASGEFVLTSGSTTVDARHALLLERVREALRHVDAGAASISDVSEGTSE